MIVKSRDENGLKAGSSQLHQHHVSKKLSKTPGSTFQISTDHVVGHPGGPSLIGCHFRNLGNFVSSQRGAFQPTPNAVSLSLLENFGRSKRVDHPDWAKHRSAH